MDDFPYAMAAAWSAYLALLYGTRRWMRQWLWGLMYGNAVPADGSASASPQGPTWPADRSAQGARHAPDAHQSHPAPAAGPLGITFLDAAWSSDGGDTHAQCAGQARRRLRQSAVLDLVVLVTFSLLLAMPGAIDAVWTGALLPLLLVLAVRYPLHRRQFWVGGGDPTDAGLLVRLAEAWLPSRTGLWVLRKLSAPEWQAPMRWALLLLMGLLGVQALRAGHTAGWMAVLVPLVVAAADVALWHQCRRDRGPALLLLRVFHKTVQGSDATVATFGGVLGTWLHFGAFVTVMDAALLRFRSPVFNLRNLSVLIGLAALCGGFSDSSQAPPMADLVLAGILGLAGWALDAWLMRRRALARMVTDPAAIGSGAGVMNPPRGASGRYPAIELVCTDASWYQTVVGLSAACQVVLMDLRGYVPDRSGCDAEVTLLFDAVPLRRIVFLIEPGRQAEIAALFARCWRTLAANSPNRLLSLPTVAVMPYPLQNELTTDFVPKKQLLLEELLFRTTGAALGRLEQAQGASRQDVDALAQSHATVPLVTRPDAGVVPLVPASRHRPVLSARAQAAVRAAIARFEGVPGLLSGTAISARQLRHARLHAGVPAEEQLLALSDMTILGSAKECWAFTDRALRYRYMQERHVLAYDYFPQRRFTREGFWNVAITAPDGTAARLNAYESRIGRDEALNMLQAISEAAAPPAVAFMAFGMPDQAVEPSSNGPAIHAALKAANQPTGRAGPPALMDEAITEAKAHNARHACFIPPEEDLLALVDLTIFGSAKQCWAFTDRALWCNGDGGRQVLEYRYFPSRSFKPKGPGAVAAHAVDGTAMVLDAGGWESGPLLALLVAVQAALRADLPVPAAAAA